MNCNCSRTNIDFIKNISRESNSGCNNYILMLGFLLIILVVYLNIKNN